MTAQLTSVRGQLTPGAVGTRQLMIEAGLHLLDQGGRDAVRLRDVGKQVGLSHNAPYRHFANKEALLGAIAAAELAQRKAIWDEVAKGELTFERGLLSHLIWAQSRPERFYLIYGRWTDDVPELTEAARAAFEAYCVALESSQRRKEMPRGDVVMLARITLAFVNGLSNLAIAGHYANPIQGRTAPEAILRRFLSMLT